MINQALTIINAMGLKVKVQGLRQKLSVSNQIFIGFSVFVISGIVFLCTGVGLVIYATFWHVPDYMGNIVIIEVVVCIASMFYGSIFTHLEPHTKGITSFFAKVKIALKRKKQNG